MYTTTYRRNTEGLTVVAEKQTGALILGTHGEVIPIVWTVETQRVGNHIITTGWLLHAGRIACTSPIFEDIQDVPADVKRVTAKHLEAIQARIICGNNDLKDMERLAMERLEKYATCGDKDAIGTERANAEVIKAVAAMDEGDIEAVLDCVDGVEFAQLPANAKAFSMRYIYAAAEQRKGRLYASERDELAAYIRAHGVVITH